MGLLTPRVSFRRTAARKLSARREEEGTSLRAASSAVRAALVGGEKRGMRRSDVQRAARAVRWWW